MVRAVKKLNTKFSSDDMMPTFGIGYGQARPCRYAPAAFAPASPSRALSCPVGTRRPRHYSQQQPYSRPSSGACVPPCLHLPLFVAAHPDQPYPPPAHRDRR